MLKLRSISKKEFDNFTQAKIDSSHFMQTSSWGEFDKITNHTTPYYLGLVDENNEIIAATLILEEHLSMDFCSLYAPRGFVIDYRDRRLLSLLTQKLKDFAHHKKAISLRINPAIIYKYYDKDHQEHINNSTIEKLNNIKNLGFKKKSNIKLLEYNYLIDLEQNYQIIQENYSNNIKEKIASTSMYDIELTIGTAKDLNELFNLQKNKKTDYYETLYDIFSNNENTKIKLFLGKLHITKTLKTIEKELRRINNQMSIIPIDNLDSSSKEKLANLKTQREKLNKDYEKFKNYKLKYGNYLTISANLMMEHNKTVWILSEANNHILDETNLRYTIYNEYIKYYKDNGFSIFKQLSPIEYHPDINEFKKEFGGQFIEYIGDYEIITNRFMYIILRKILPIFKKEKEENYGTSNT